MRKRYTIRIIEELVRDVVVVAENEDEAWSKVKERYDDCKYVLGGDDFAGVEFYDVTKAKREENV